MDLELRGRFRIWGVLFKYFFLKGEGISLKGYDVWFYNWSLRGLNMKN